MEPTGEVPLITLGKSEFEKLVDGEKPGVDSKDERKHTRRNDLSFVGKMM